MWCITGDLENILNVEGRIEGAPVHLLEYQDLQKMMRDVDIFECRTIREFSHGQTGINMDYFI